VGYLRTILTYNVPSEAEVDKAFLESHGINVCLLNANTARNELGAPFYVRLQVMDEDVERASSLIKDANPSRFGSQERVNEIDRQIKRSVVRFVLISAPMGFAAFLLAYMLNPIPAHNEAMFVHQHWTIFYFRIRLSVLAGITACILTTLWDSRRLRKVPSGT
jgi:hypothetical protein